MKLPRRLHQDSKNCFSINRQGVHQYFSSVEEGLEYMRNNGIPIEWRDEYRNPDPKARIGIVLAKLLENAGKPVLMEGMTNLQINQLVTVLRERYYYDVACHAHKTYMYKFRAPQNEDAYSLGMTSHRYIRFYELLKDGEPHDVLPLLQELKMNTEQFNNLKKNLNLTYGFGMVRATKAKIQEYYLELRGHWRTKDDSYVSLRSTAE